MRILAVDYGDARTGIAVSDNSEFLASPVGTIKEYNAERLAQKVADISREQNAGEIIVGLPINMNGTEGPRAEKCREFGDMLRELVDVEVKMWDERSTTVTAHQFLNEIPLQPPSYWKATLPTGATKKVIPDTDMIISALSAQNG